MGIEVDHLGGITSVAEPQFEIDMQTWCIEHNIPVNGNAGLAVYLEAEWRFLTEYRDKKHFIPCRVGADYVASC